MYSTAGTGASGLRSPGVISLQQTARCMFIYGLCIQKPCCAHTQHYTKVLHSTQPPPTARTPATTPFGLHRCETQLSHRYQHQSATVLSFWSPRRPPTSVTSTFVVPIQSFIVWTLRVPTSNSRLAALSTRSTLRPTNPSEKCSRRPNTPLWVYWIVKLYDPASRS